jgi:NAD(P)-dependent dehydrogenase (short-subunit alcohol dehydrogenase family)
MSRLRSKVAVVTGGANGLGAAIAHRMVEEGAAVAVLDWDPSGQEVADKLAAGGAQTLFVQVDVTEEDAVAAAFGTVGERLGRIDALVNNAGVEGANLPTDQFPLEEWERVMGINCTAVFLCTKHVVPHLRRAGGGSIVNISSIYGILGGADIPPYHASKGAVRAMSKNDALTYAADRIRVNSIHPGFVFTDMVNRYVDEAGMDRGEARTALDALHPLGGTGTPDDVAWGAVYLASDEARWVTGSELVIDGGYTAR